MRDNPSNDIKETIAAHEEMRAGYRNIACPFQYRFIDIAERCETPTDYLDLVSAVSIAVEDALLLYFRSLPLEEQTTLEAATLISFYIETFIDGIRGRMKDNCPSISIPSIPKADLTNP